MITLALALAKAEFKLKNEGSYLGFFWYLVNPVLTFLLLWLIFSDRLGQNIPYYPVYIFLGVIMFNFFQSALLESSRIIIHDYHYLIKSINFPRQALILAIIFKHLFSHAAEIILLDIIMLVFGLNPVYLLYYLPVLVVFAVFVFGMCLLISALAVYVVDLENICSFAVKILWLGTPIFYAIGGQTRLFYLNLFNPLYYFISAARILMISHAMPPAWLILGAAALSVGFAVIGWLVFGILKTKFAELI